MAGTYPETLLQPDNTIGEFLAATVAYVGSKVFDESMGHTWFSGSTGAASIDTRYLNLTLRIKRSDNFIYSYYKTSGGDWVSIGQPVALAQDLHNVPLQFGCRVRKEWKTFHNFNIIATKLAGGSPLPIPTKNPTTSPTETQTWISELPTTQNYGPACHSTLDRSSVSNYPYQTRGIGGGGAMSGLSISPWNSLWFVGTDMGTIFRSTDAGFVWYPVSHYEAKYHSRLVVSASVGYTSDPEIIVHATCDENVASSDCVAQRSVDSGITWNPINITGGTRVDHLGNPVLDEIPKQFYGSLVQNSGLVYCSTFNSGKVFKSSDDGLNWSQLSLLPFNTTNLAVGLFLDEISSPTRYIYFATTAGIYMWKDGHEADARQIHTMDGSTTIHSFTGARNGDVLMLSFVDSDTTACEGDINSDCGFVHTYHETITTAAAEVATFTFTKTNQRAFRLVSSVTDSEVLYAMGARSWPSATGTKVWVGSYDAVQGSFAFTLKFRQYPLWNSDKLDYSGVGLDVGYWDGGYYIFTVKPNDSAVAGGTGNFFLHVTRNTGDNWESPFTEYADGCNTNGIRESKRRWRSTGLEMTSVRWIKFNPYNPDYAYAAVADIRMLRSDDGGETFMTGAAKTDPIFDLNTVYDFDFKDANTVFAVGGNFHDWPHEWYKNLRRGAGGVFTSFNSGEDWFRVGALASSNCDDSGLNVDCSLGDDMNRQILSVKWHDGILYIGSQSAGVARLVGLNDVLTIEDMQDLEWEWINNDMGSLVDRIVPELKIWEGKLFALLTGNAPYFTNNGDVGIYEFDPSSLSWSIKKGTVVRHPDIAAPYNLWDYPTSFDIDANGNMFLVDLETNGNYLASGIWKSADDGNTWNRVQQFTHTYHIICVGSRVYASGGRSISHVGHAGWGDGGAFYSDDGGSTWLKNEDSLPLLSNLNSVAVDPADDSKVFYTFFGGGMLHGPRPIEYGTGPFVTHATSSEIVTIPRPPVPPDLADTFRSNCPQNEAGLLSWHADATWLGGLVPTSGDVTLPSNSKVIISQSVIGQLGIITVPETSELIFDENEASPIALDLTGMDIQGAIRAGSETCRYLTELTITLYGTRPNDLNIQGQSSTATPTYKGISVNGDGGILSMHGKRYYPTWTRLAETVPAGQDYLLVQEEVNWEIGQEIVLTTTAIHDSRAWHQNEVLTILSIVSNPAQGVGSAIHFTTPTAHAHIANNGFQAEVGLLSRNIKIRETSSLL